MQPLDKKDLIILSELLADGRISYSDLSEKIKLSVPATKSRVEKLLEKGIIDSFTVDIDFSLLTEGRPSIIAIKAPSKYLHETMGKLYNSKLVRKIFLSGGKYNLLLLTHYITDAQKSKLITEIQNLETVEDLEVTILYEELLEKKDIVVMEPKNIKLICDFCKREFSDTIFSKVIGLKKRYFCCNTCLDEYEKRFKIGN